MAGRRYIVHTRSEEYWIHEGTWRQELVSDPLEKPISIPDGFWVLEVYLHSRGIGSGGSTCVIVGPKPQMITLKQNHHRGGSQKLLVGREPFGVLLADWDDSDKPPTGRRLQLARQIHKGELGRTPPINKPSYLLEGSQHRGSRNRNRIGWGRLTEVAAMAGITVEEMLANYWPVIDYNAGDFYRPAMESHIQMLDSDGLPVVNNERVEPVLTYDRSDIIRMLGENTDWSRFWIRKGTANAILYLVHFGHSFEPSTVPA